MIQITSHSPLFASPADREELAALAVRAEGLAGVVYWNQCHEPGRIAAAHLGSSAWVVAHDGDRLVGTARAISDGAKCAWVYDVVIAEELRGRGVGRQVMAALLDHPAVRGARWVHLGTSDADGFYERLGFGPNATVCAVPWRRITMTRDQGAAGLGL